MEYKIAIPTKGRAGKIDTLVIFKDAVLFVEPQESKVYKEIYPNNEIVILPENDKGISYVRNYILNYYDCVVFVLDDDITKIYSKQGKKLKKIEDISDFINACLTCIKKGYKQVTISFKASNWMHDGLFKINTRCWCINVFDCSLKDIRYDSKSDVFEDYDFTAQLISKGYKNISLYNFAFDCRTMGTNEGGWQLFDRKSKSATAFKYLMNKWGPQVITSRKNKVTGLQEVQFNWRYL